MNAIGLIELNSIAKGIEVWDRMMKVASVELITATTLCPGKYMVIVSGDVGAVETSVSTGIETSCEWLIDSLVIPNIDPQIFPAITASAGDVKIEALGMVETFSAASGILFADAAVKAASVHLIELRLSMGLGGKSIIYLTGEVGAVNAAVNAGKSVIKPDMVADINVIASPHYEVGKILE
jgi:microcompartment protein CcmL/EutN